MTKLDRLNKFAKDFAESMTKDEFDAWMALDLNTRKCIIAAAFFSKEAVYG